MGLTEGATLRGGGGVRDGGDVPVAVIALVGDGEPERFSDARGVRRTSQGCRELARPSWPRGGGEISSGRWGSRRQ
jgi:hypothetical protein